MLPLLLKCCNQFAHNLRSCSTTSIPAPLCKPAASLAASQLLTCCLPTAILLPPCCHLPLAPKVKLVESKEAKNNKNRRPACAPSHCGQTLAPGAGEAYDVYLEHIFKIFANSVRPPQHAVPLMPEVLSCRHACPKTQVFICYGCKRCD